MSAVITPTRPSLGQRMRRMGARLRIRARIGGLRLRHAQLLVALDLAEHDDSPDADLRADELREQCTVIGLRLQMAEQALRRA